jgi:UPF0716 family protein affecting phage T7 exclusion
VIDPQDKLVPGFLSLSIGLYAIVCRGWIVRRAAERNAARGIPYDQKLYRTIGLCAGILLIVIGFLILAGQIRFG